ncbi:TLC domain-domain-containing protein [Leucosporidium creatinivorum]|uniref:TLC domain-domain-containing protein n=1 Tax=Leucosporidium creatinivorum TaxID=106004 RepID=A0A1Y2D7H4_9BASI|nr:TLC domain-domain-containing protein [Leucosporidium creatinivorum]
MASTRRRRSSSLTQYLADIEENPAAHHLLHLGASEAQTDDAPIEPVPSTPYPPQAARPRISRRNTPQEPPRKVVVELKRGPKWLHWLTTPADSFAVLATIFSLWAAWRTFLPSYRELNPFSAFLFVSYPVAWGHEGKETRFKKGPRDLLFLGFWIVVFSFVRSTIMQGPLKRLGRKLGVRRRRKLERFEEQGYAIFYFGLSSIAGLYVMTQQDSWFFQLEHLWLDYPNHWAMSRGVKTYYLTQFAYWLHESLVMIAGLEKPRDDFMELVLHHIVTAWLVGASYIVNLTQIGILIFFSMDLPDLMLSISKCINYVGLEKTGNVSFLIFMAAWSYFRHYQNIRILHSVWTEAFTLIPSYAQVMDPAKGFWVAPFMRYQIFLPIFLLQLLVAFWSYLILRVLYRMLTGSAASDVREEGETDTEATTGGNSVVEGSRSGSPMLGGGAGGGGGLSPALPIKDLRTRSRSGTMTSIHEGEDEPASQVDGAKNLAAEWEGPRTRTRSARKED